LRLTLVPLIRQEGSIKGPPLALLVLQASPRLLSFSTTSQSRSKYYQAQIFDTRSTNQRRLQEIQPSTIISSSCYTTADKSRSSNTTSCSATTSHQTLQRQDSQQPPSSHGSRDILVIHIPTLTQPILPINTTTYNTNNSPHHQPSPPRLATAHHPPPTNDPQYQQCAITIGISTMAAATPPMPSQGSATNNT
jgi:hypothetical protein